ncbi:MAG: RnfABCDGE type electron transport complex subunit D [Ruminococcus sp.]|jgi:electron transport complex protein RnfD|nr:RnfABCDGE type electron transport complex subunit D [Ruminococcus sp.]
MRNLTVTPSPHIGGPISTSRVMGAVCAALLPSCAVGVYRYGLRALFIILISVASCLLFEYLFCVLVRKKSTIGDLSAVVTGLLLAMNLSSQVPYFIPILGGFIAIVIVKMLFGGLGQNFANPAITARIVLMVSFGSQMSVWAKPVNNLFAFDAATGPTPLAAPLLVSNGVRVLPFTFSDMLLGNTGGCIGETCALALIIGGIFLMIIKVIKPHIPIAFIGTVFVLTLIYTKSIDHTIYYTLAGGLMLGAFFMATDYTTSPITNKGKIIFGIGCGLITFVIRFFTNFPEGVSFSILLMNFLCPLIDDYTQTKPIGATPKVKTASAKEAVKA